MDYARKIGKKDPGTAWGKANISVLTVQDDLICRDVPFSEDRRLLNWKKWLADRKKQSERIKSRTDRYHTEQVLNSSEKIRPFIEMRNLLEYANEPVLVISDKYRGGPEFWKVPISLSSGCGCLPELFTVPTKKDLNIKPELLYTATPDLIKKEKHLSGLNLKEPRWKKSGYLKRRKQELAEEIKGVISKEPEVEGLVIQGKARQEKKKEGRIPLITIASPEELESESEKSEEDSDYAIVLKIQDREIVHRKSAFKSGESNESPFVWDVKFDGIVNKRHEQEVVFENKGNCTIVYQWRDVLVDQDLFPLRTLSTPFFFNKTKSIIMPGQFVHLKIWYLPRYAGIATETWTIVTEPKLCPQELMLRFWGHAQRSLKSSIALPSDIIDNYIDECVHENAIRKLDNETDEEPNVFEGPQCTCHFTDAEIFQCKNPSMYYHPDIVIRSRRLYRKAVASHRRVWNLSLGFLKETLLRVRAPEDRDKMLIQFTEICNKKVGRVESNKYLSSYKALCSFFDTFESVEEDIKSIPVAMESAITMDEEKQQTNVSQVSVDSKTSARKRKRTLSSSNSAQQESQTAEVSTEVHREPQNDTFFNFIRDSLIEIMDEICDLIKSTNININFNTNSQNYELCV